MTNLFSGILFKIIFLFCRITIAYLYRQIFSQHDDSEKEMETFLPLYGSLDHHVFCRFEFLIKQTVNNIRNNLIISYSLSNQDL